MSQRRIVYIDVRLRVSDEGKVSLNLSEKLEGFFSKEEIEREIEEILIKDGWKKEGNTLVKEDKTSKIVYDIEKEEIKVIVKREKITKVRESSKEQSTMAEEDKLKRAVSSEVELILEVEKERFKEKYIPELIKNALKKRAKALDPAASVISEKEDDDSLTLTISLEV